MNLSGELDTVADVAILIRGGKFMLAAEVDGEQVQDEMTTVNKLAQALENLIVAAIHAARHQLINGQIDAMLVTLEVRRTVPTDEEIIETMRKMNRAAGTGS